MEARCADAKQPPGVLWAVEAAGYHTAAGRGIPAGSGQECMPGDVKPGTGFAQAYVQHCGTMWTALGDESRPAGEVSAGEQLPLPDA